MYKYIHDSIKNNSRCVLEGLSKPQQKALSEIIRDLFTAGEPILRHIAQDQTKSAKKQAEKYSHHLGDKEPIRLIHSLKFKFSKNQIMSMYLQCWGVENIFKRVKEKTDPSTEMAKVRQFSGTYSIGSFGLNDDVFKDSTVNKYAHNWGLNVLQKIHETQKFRVQR